MAGKHLESERIIETVRVLGRRIKERFPDAGLNDVCQELYQISRQARQRSIEIGRPMLGVRILSGTVIAVIFVVFAVLVARIRDTEDAGERLQFGEFVQVIEAGANALVLSGATVIFLVTLETRVKRARALKAIHELRSIAHIIDMHQLTKDPERILWKGMETQSSPKRTMTQFQLNRYLDYCSEMLALAGKVAALYVENFPDSDAVSAVNDIEDLTSGMSRKIWQKIMLLHELSDDSVQANKPLPKPAAHQGPGSEAIPAIS